MNNNEIHAPIKEKLGQWIFYKENQHTMSPDAFRQKHDLDCILTDGNLYADTIISLWNPLIQAIKEIHGKQRLYKNVETLRKIRDNLDYYLPVDNTLVQTLSRLFEIGLTRANVMILPERIINVLRYRKTHDYMPYFLHLCFVPDSTFGAFFKTEDFLKSWIEEEHLHMFFTNGEITQENVKKLSGADDIKMSKPANLEDIFKKYIEILEERSLYY